MSVRPLAAVLLALLAAAPAFAQEAPTVPGDTAFALDLYREIRRTEGGNFFVSPYSISSALGMTYAGARGSTAGAMRTALHAGPGVAEFHRGRSDLDQALRARAGEARDRGDPFRLRVVNELWGQVDQPFRREFLELLGEHYGAGLRLVDFSADPEAARRAINESVEEATEDRIQDLLRRGDVSSATRLVLTNAIFFKASWFHAFEKEATRKAPFRLLDGSRVEADTMTQTEVFRRWSERGFDAIELPYVGNTISMVVLAPAPGEFDGFEASLSPERLAEFDRRLEHARVEVSLPRFEIQSRFSLKDVLTALGMGEAFTGEADFSGMTGSRDLFIGSVIHQTFVKVDEAGTEAAAATAVVMDGRGSPHRPSRIAIDRPFVFYLRDAKTGAILFLGRVVDPR